MIERTGDIAGYARMLIGARVKHEQSSRIFGGPYMKLAQSYALRSYFFQLGCILGSRYRDRVDTFYHAMFGLAESGGQVAKLASENLVPTHVNENMKFSDYVLTDLMGLNGTHDLASFMSKSALSKVDSKTVMSDLWTDTLDGAAVGICHPAIVRGMFALSYAPMPKDSWDRARNAGVSLPEKQDLMTYDELEDEETSAFLHYCNECCPHLHDLLSA
ncbi:hypothetical protein [Luteimonas sp. A482]